MKIAVLSEALPPSKTGQAIVLSRLLEVFAPEDYCLISAYGWGGNDKLSRQPGQLPGRYYQLESPPLLNRGYRYGLAHIREAINIPAGVVQRSKQVADIIRSERCDAVVACTGDLLDLPAGYRAAQRAGVPFYAYIFDHYSYREWASPVRRFWARRFEPWVLKGADGVISTNEILRDDLWRHYRVESTIVHNSFDVLAYKGPTHADTRVRDREFKIIYTGDIYEAHYDAFRNLLAAIESLGRENLKLHVYTARSSDELALMNIKGPIVFHAPRPPSEMPRIQQEADVLFLPLAFNSPYSKLVRTSATGKMGEYLATGRPVLAHAPADSFLAWYFRKHECGVLVDQFDHNLLAQVLEQVLTDEDLRQRVTARAWERALADFDITVARERFINLLQRGAKRRAREV
jgi:glycosyltransferase involved in cell wall biosynthesis